MMTILLAFLMSFQEQSENLFERLRSPDEKDHERAFRALCDGGNKTRAAAELAIADPTLKWWAEAVLEELRARREGGSAWNPRRVSMQFEKQPLSDALKALGLSTISPLANNPVTVDLKDATLHEALEAALASAGVKATFTIGPGRSFSDSFTLRAGRSEPLAHFRTPSYAATLERVVASRVVEGDVPVQGILRLYINVSISPEFPGVSVGKCVLTEILDGSGLPLEVMSDPDKMADSQPFHWLGPMPVESCAYLRLKGEAPERLSLIRGYVPILSQGGHKQITVKILSMNGKQTLENDGVRLRVALYDQDSEYGLLVEIEPISPQWNGAGLGDDPRLFTLRDSENTPFQRSNYSANSYSSYRVAFLKHAARIPETATIGIRTNIFERRVYFEFRGVNLR